VLNSMSGLGPTNPADIGASTAAFKRLRRAARSLLFALDALGHCDWRDADENLDDAEMAVGLRDDDAPPSAPPPVPAGLGEVEKQR
jgi:hypothetical protein